MLGIGGTLTGWHCIPCGASNIGKSPYCAACGRHHDDATDAARWKRFFTLDAEIVAKPTTEQDHAFVRDPADPEHCLCGHIRYHVIHDESCPHDHVLKDDDGRDNWFYVCDDCDKVVQLSEPDEDGKSYWEVIE